jgi:hypothetical protein
VLTRLGPRDERAYREAVARVAVRADGSLQSAVVAERAILTGLPGRGGPTLVVEDLRSARRRFRREASRLSRSRPGPVVMADVRAFFCSVTPGGVGHALLGAGCHPADVSPVLRLLERFGEHDVRGLPIGPEASAVLANAVLASVDDALAATGARHLRWVDDFLVFPSRARDAAGMLDRLSDALAAIGLELAPEKCGIQELADTALGRSLRPAGHERRTGPLASSLG